MMKEGIDRMIRKTTNPNNIENSLIPSDREFDEYWDYGREEGKKLGKEWELVKQEKKDDAKREGGE